MLNNTELESAIAPVPAIVTPDTPLMEPISLMSKDRQSCPLPVANQTLSPSLGLSEQTSCAFVCQNHRLVGILTERDFVQQAATGHPLGNLTVAQVMTPDPLTLKRSQFRDIFTALNLFRQHGIRHLPIVDETSQPIGVVTPTTLRQLLQPAHLLHMRKVVEVMNAPVVQGPPTASLLELTQLMTQHHVSCVAIVRPEKPDSIPIGIVTERDILQFQAKGLDFSQISAREVMSGPVFTVGPHSSLWEACQQMQQRQIRRLLVTGTTGKLLGIITETSVMQALDPWEMYNIINCLQSQVCQLEQEKSEMGKQHQLELARQAELERRVEQRTAELKQTNQQLQQEIIKSQRIEAALWDSQEILHDIFDNANDLIQSVSLTDGSFLYVNRTWCETLGYSQEESQQLSIFDVIHPDYQDHCRNTIEQLKTGKDTGSIRLEVVFLTKDNQSIILEGNINCRYHQGKPTTTEGIFRDITERKQSEKQLQQALEELSYHKIALDQFALVAITDAEGIITYVNDKLCEVSQYERAELIGKTHRLINSGYHPQSFFQEMWSAIAGGQIWRGEIKNRKKDGSFHWVDSIIVPFLDSKGKAFQYLAIRIDITGRQLAEEQLKQKLAAIEAAIDGIAILKGDTYIYLNQAHLKMFGYDTAEELIGQSWKKLYQDSEISRFENEIFPMLAREKAWGGEATAMGKDARTFAQEVSLTITDDNLLICVCRDISKRKATEKWLRLNQFTLESAEDAVLFIKPNGQLFYVNAAASRQLGYTRAELLKMKVHDIDKNCTDLFWREHWPQLKQAKSLTRETIYSRKNGSQFPVEISINYLNFNEQEYNCAIVRDISDRKNAEIKLRRAKEKLQAVLDAVPGLISWVGYEPDRPQPLTYLGVNQHLADTLNLAPKYFVGKQVGSMQKNNVFANIMSDFFASPMQQITREIMVEVKSKPRNYLLVAQKYDRGNAAVSVGIDITDRKQAEANMRKALAREKELSELKSRFISMTSHEFRTPLAVIYSSVGILKTFGHKLSEEKKQTHFQTIDKYIHHTTRLLDDILMINRVEAGEIQFNPEAIDLASFCENLVTEMQTSSPQHQLIFTCHSHTWDQSQASMDQKLLRQILTNLLSNAIKYSSDGGEVNLDLTTKPEKVIFQVKDCGIGIPPSDQEKLFESFHRASNVGTIQGTGLGLSIVKRCVDLHGGQISFESQAGVGTTFTVTIPAGKVTRLTHSN